MRFPAFCNTLFQQTNVGIPLCLLLEFNGIIGNPFNYIVLEDNVHCEFCNFLFYPVPANGFLFTGLLLPASLAGVVVMQHSAFAGAGFSDHISPTVPTEQLAGEQIVPILPVSALGVLFVFKVVLHQREVLLGDDGRNGVFLHEVHKTVGADIGIVFEHHAERVLIPSVPVLGLNTPGVQVGGNICLRLPSENAAVYLADNLGLGGVDFVAVVLPFAVSVWDATVDSKIFGVVLHGTHDVFG